MNIEASPLPTLPPGKETAIINYLQSENCVFHRKPAHPELPQVDPGKLTAYFDSNAESVGMLILPILTRFTQMVPITDPFTDHHDRRAWRLNLPSPVREYYERKNQLRGNNINAVSTAMALMSEYCHNDRIAGICNGLSEKITCGFAEMSDDEKLDLVREVEAGILEIMKCLS